MHFIFTAFLIAWAMLHLVKNTASKYFEVDASFEGSGGGVSHHDPMPLPSEPSRCANCDAAGVKQCSRCKSVKYWSKPVKKPGETLQLGQTGISALWALKLWKQLFCQCGFAMSHIHAAACCLLIGGRSPRRMRDDWCFLCAFQAHVERATRDSQPFSPINILSRLPNIGGNLGYGRQEDAHEFMRFAIDTMQSVCLDEFGGEKAVDPATQETTLIQHIFGGHLQSKVICTSCNKESDQFENMMDLTVEIHGDATSLEKCLDQFTAKEWLHGENMYKCDGCNGYVKAWKRLTIRRAPNILTIALKRFQSGRFGKLNKRVTFPETLDLTPYMSEGGDGTDIYRLYAVVVHVDMLNASFFGHYICYTKDFFGNWYRIDDCKVAKVKLDEVLSQGAYMLLYNRVSVRPSCLRVVEPLKEKHSTPTLGSETSTEKPEGIQVLGSADTMSSSRSPIQSDNSLEVAREPLVDVANAISSSGVPKGVSCENGRSFRVAVEEDEIYAMDIDSPTSSKCTSAEHASFAFNIGATSDDPQRRNGIVCDSTPSHVNGVSSHVNDLSAATDSSSVPVEYSSVRDLVNSEPSSGFVKDAKANGAIVKNNTEANGTIVKDVKVNGGIVNDIEDSAIFEEDMENRVDAEASSLLSLFAAVSYGIASMAMVFINKAIIMQYAHSMTLLTVQQLATALLIHFGRQTGHTKGREVDMQTARRLLPVSLFYNANVAFALASLKGTHPACCAYCWFLYRKGKAFNTVLLTAAGVLIAALGDFSFDLFGYGLALISVFFQTMYLVLVEKSGAEDGLSSIEIMFYNSFLSLPFLGFLIIITGEFPNSLSLLFAKSNSLSFLVIFILSLVMGIVLNYTMFLCTIVNSALTTTIVGVLKGVGLSVLSCWVEYKYML
ncbi:hypothetical protein Tsubulata_038223 [Turnera subulata]|uniref:USP domain-containing protein n=1 Tax=Turnera subulata TaxID=218843 RepID=A0A9Q0J0X6_9ROSI|nr:hypothetical protein Tsubulata_038223 [Turnera subulata]